jgi:hypothetical protein
MNQPVDAVSHQVDASGERYVETFGALETVEWSVKLALLE